LPRIEIRQGVGMRRCLVKARSERRTQEYSEHFVPEQSSLKRGEIVHTNTSGTRVLAVSGKGGNPHRKAGLKA